MWELIVTQLIVCAIQYYIANSENIKRILIATFLFNVFNLICYLLNDYPVLTFTWVNPIKCNYPSKEYVDVINRGIREIMLKGAI